MTDTEVTITKDEYRRLLECEDDARRRKNMCAGCGALAQRDNIIANLEKRITNELSGGVRDLQHKLKLIRDVCGFKDIPLREKIIGDPYIFIDSILRRIVEIVDERNNATDNGATRTACGLKMINEALKQTVEQTKEIIRLAKEYGYVKGDEKLTLPEIVKLAEKVSTERDNSND